MKSLWNKILNFLRDPAVESTAGILSLLILIGGTLKGWFDFLAAFLGNYIPWLNKKTTLPNWLAILLLVLLIFLIFRWSFRGRENKKNIKMKHSYTYKKKVDTMDKKYPCGHYGQLPV